MMPKNERSRVTDSVNTATGTGDGYVAVPGEQTAGADGVSGPDAEQWPVDGRDMRLRVNRDTYDAGEGTTKGPDPAEWAGA